MGLLDIFGDILGGGGGGGQPRSAPTPIYRNAPRTIRSFQNKYAQLGPLLRANYSPGVSNSLMAFDQQRVQRGVNPLSKTQTLRIANAASTNEGFTPQPDRTQISDIPGNAINDLFEIGSSVIKLPWIAAQQVKEIPDAVQRIPRLLAQGDIATVLEQPGINLIPGAFVASNLIRGDTEELIKHPLYTGLDVLPYAKKPVAKLGGRVAATPKAQKLTAGIRGSQPYQQLQVAFGRQSRDVASLVARTRAELTDLANPQTPHLMGGRFDAIWNQQAHKLITDFPTIAADEARRISITRTAQLEPQNIKSLAPEEQAYLGRARELVSEAQRYFTERGDMATVMFDGKPEAFDLATGRALMNNNNYLTLAKNMNRVRTEVASGTPIPDPIAYIRSAPDEFMRAGFDRTPRKKGGFTTALRKQVAEGYARNLDSQGYDVAPLYEAIGKVRNRADLESVAELFSTYTPTAKPLLPLDGILATASEASRAGDRIGVLLEDSIKRGDLKRGADLVSKLGKRTKLSGYFDDPALVRESLLRHAGFKSYLKTTAGWSEKRVSLIERQQTRLQEKNLPARFLPKRNELVQGKIQEDIATRYSDDPNFAEIQSHVENRMYELLPDMEDAASIRNYMRPFEKEAAQTVLEMRRKGFDPFFIHTVRPDQVFQANVPTVLPKVTTPTQVRKAVGDVGRSTSDIQVALQHQGMEMLNQNGNAHVVNTIADTWGRPIVELEQEFAAAAKRRFERDPSRTYSEHLEGLIKREWSKFEPEDFINFPKSRLGFDPEAIWIPKAMRINLQKMQTPFEFKGAWDPILGAFRTAVLPLSLRWQTNNIMGGYLMLSAETNPLTAFKYLGDYLQIKKDIANGIPPRSPTR